jgi:hypothetical protein
LISTFPGRACPRSGLPEERLGAATDRRPGIPADRGGGRQIVETLSRSVRATIVMVTAGAGPATKERRTPTKGRTRRSWTRKPPHGLLLLAAEPAGGGAEAFTAGRRRPWRRSRRVHPPGTSGNTRAEPGVDASVGPLLDEVPSPVRPRICARWLRGRRALPPSPGGAVSVDRAHHPERGLAGRPPPAPP